MEEEEIIGAEATISVSGHEVAGTERMEGREAVTCPRRALTGTEGA